MIEEIDMGIEDYLEHLRKATPTSKRSMAQKERNMITKVCPVCGAEFVAPRAGRKWCSRACLAIMKNETR